MHIFKTIGLIFLCLFIVSSCSNKKNSYQLDYVSLCQETSINPIVQIAVDPRNIEEISTDVAKKLKIRGRYLPLSDHIQFEKGDKFALYHELVHRGLRIIGASDPLNKEEYFVLFTLEKTWPKSQKRTDMHPSAKEIAYSVEFWNDNIEFYHEIIRVAEIYQKSSWCEETF